MKKILITVLFSAFILVGCTEENGSFVGMNIVNVEAYAFAKEYEKLSPHWLTYLEEFNTINKADLPENEKYDALMQLAERHQRELMAYRFKDSEAIEDKEFYQSVLMFCNQFSSLLDMQIFYYSLPTVTQENLDKIDKAIELTGAYNMNMKGKAMR